MGYGRLYQKLVERFGAAVVAEAFGQRITSAHIRRLRNMEISTPEEYALLSILLKLGPDALFGGQEIPDCASDRMQGWQTPDGCSPSKVLPQIWGIRTRTSDAICQAL